MTVIIDTNTHTISGELKVDAQHKLFDQNPAIPPIYRFKFRFGCRKTYRVGADVKTRITWFNVKFDVAPEGFAYYEEKLKKGARVLVVGEQLVDEDDGPAGRRYWQFIRGNTISILAFAPVDAAARQTPATAAPMEAPADQRRPAEPAHRPPPPRQSTGDRPAQLRPSRPSPADAKEDQATRNRTKNLPATAFSTHFGPQDW